jgi:DNA-nicking Smr family endonuclease
MPTVSRKKSSIPLKPPPVKKPDYSLLARGNYAGMDGSAAERLRKGKYEIDGRLDLHGYTRDKAQAKLKAFIRSHYTHCSRCLLVITGKGTKDAPGVLKDLVPDWVNADDVRPMVLAFDHARQQHGGSGAYYILLKRKR